MQYTREEAVGRLLDSYKAYYNVTKCESGPEGLAAVCEFYEHSEKFVLSKKAELWSADCEEFLYLFEVPVLTLAVYERCRDFAYQDGMERAHIGRGHMYTYITPIFVCDTCQEDAQKALKKCHIYKSFHFALHGWMDFHTAVFEVSSGRISSNRSGRCVEKVLKNVLFQTRKKGRGLV